MEKLFNNLLISSPNDGGIFFIHEKIVFKLDNFDTTGLFVIGKKVLRGIQPSRLYIYDTKLPEITNSSLKYDDIHDVCEHDNYIYVVGTTGNEIIKLNKFGEEIKRWVFPGEEDSHHINCVGLWNGRIVFSAFGDFTEHRGYKGNTDNSGRR